MRTLRRFVAQEDGIALATVIFMIAVLTVLAATLLVQVTDESNRAANATNSDAVYQAAEAGIGDYVAKLMEDPAYYDHVVANGEATRTSCTTFSSGNCTAWGSLTVQHGASWTTGTHWGYNATATNHKDNWYRGTGNGFGNSTLLVGYAYDLMITPPSPTLGTPPGTNYVTILSSGCKLVSGGTTCDSTVPMRSIRVRVSRNTPADFQYMTPDMNGVNVCFGSNLYGKVYSVGDINVCGADAYGNLLSDNNGSVASMCSGGSCGVTLHSPARIYDRTHPNIRDVIPNKITFAQLNVSISNIQRAAALNSPTTVFDDSTAAAWRINFSANGNYQAWRCIRPSGTSDTAYGQPFCGGDLTIASGGAAKSAKTVNVTSSTSEFPSSSSIYIGSGSTWEKFTYSSKTDTSFTCSGTCGLAKAHLAGETVSIKSGGINWLVPWQTGAIPLNGAIYTAQNAIVSWPSAIPGGYNTGGCPSYVGTAASSVNGRVTLGSNGDIDVAGNICLLSQVSPNPNDDVLGLVANNNIWITDYAPSDLWWRAATIALNGAWGDYDVTKRMTLDPYGNGSGLNHSMTFTGTASYASASGAMQSGDGSYGYNIDNVNRLADDGSMAAIGVCPSTTPGCTSFNALYSLFPPWFPVLNGENIDLFQEVANDDLPPVG